MTQFNFTYMHKVTSEISVEMDGVATLDRNNNMEIMLCCQDKNEYESVHSETDLYREITKFLCEDDYYSAKLGECTCENIAGVKAYDKEMARA